MDNSTKNQSLYFNKIGQLLSIFSNINWQQNRSILLRLCAFFIGLLFFSFSQNLYAQNWQQKGVDIDGEALNDESGRSVSLSADGNTLAIGAPENDGGGNSSGHVRVYSWNGTAWQPKGTDINGKAPRDNSGFSISLSADGNILAIGAPENDEAGNNSGHVRVYFWNGGTWQQRGADINGQAANDESGHSVSLSADGNTLAIGARLNDGNGQDAGSVRIYSWDAGTSTWRLKGNVINGDSAEDYLGTSVSLSADGNMIAMGAPQNFAEDESNGKGPGYVKILAWDNTTSTWLQKGNNIIGEIVDDKSGWSIALSNNGNTVAIGALDNDGNGQDAGHVRVYSWEAGTSTWLQKGSDIDGEVLFCLSGASVSLAADGNLVAIGSPQNNGIGEDAGHARIYFWDGAAWQQRCVDIDGEERFDLSGTAVSLSANGATIAIGAPQNNGNGNNSGHVRVFESPLISIDGPRSLCPGTNNVTYRIINPVAGITTYTWTVPPGFEIVSGQDTSTIIVNVLPTAQSGRITVTTNSTFCYSFEGLEVEIIRESNPQITKSCNLLTTNATGNLQWFKDGVLIAGATGSRLIVREPGYYEVEVVGRCGTWRSGITVTLADIREDFSIEGKKFVCVEEPPQAYTYSLSPVNLALTYTWIVPPGFEIESGQGTSSITVKINSNAISGIIIVTDGKLTCPASDTLKVFTNRDLQPEIVRVSCSNTLSIRNEETFISIGSSFQWFKDGVPIDGATGSRLVVTEPGSYQVQTSEDCTPLLSAPYEVTSLVRLIKQPYTISGETFACLNNKDKLIYHSSNVSPIFPFINLNSIYTYIGYNTPLFEDASNNLVYQVNVAHPELNYDWGLLREYNILNFDDDYLKRKITEDIRLKKQNHNTAVLTIENPLPVRSLQFTTVLISVNDNNDDCTSGTAIRLIIAREPELSGPQIFRSCNVLYTNAQPPFAWFKDGQPVITDSINSQSLTITEEGEYQVRVFRYCNPLASEIYKISPVDFEKLRVSNVFTPNGDGKNDYFELPEELRGSQLTIYNRWGKLIYESEDYQNDWGAGDFPKGIYYYRIVHPCLTKDPLKGLIERTGWLEIIK